ncbi:2-amino-4-hydroxy-6-hydroxymethyldihydropteridine diphosphokinase [Bacillus massiliglaciei]|uniref:2-amino-4-hydroxy-6- hydroxymethyldihydropteridine diphosphokinase n=1 Tax=Bacillus massiliglaciei TaxID=1816693 RepID=UPI000A7D7941|nr:2-amino-4-hydroxy-6-hydroxymethyldihydropteridine diphosphokinase [Bacillus massiliglaciei]
MDNLAYLSIGSNMGDRLATFKKAVKLLNEYPEIRVMEASSLYETDPVGYTEQDCFLNAVLKLETSFDPENLLHACLDIESKLGRKRDIRWGPRTLDLDILLYNQENIETEILSIPHPRIQERAFVMVPLLELDPDIKLPNMSAPLSEDLKMISNNEGVRLWKQKNGEEEYVLFEN